MTFGASVLSLVLRSFLPVPLAFDARQLFRCPLFVLLFVPRLSFPPFHFQSLSFPQCFPLGHPMKITGNKLDFGLFWRRHRFFYSRLRLRLVPPALCIIIIIWRVKLSDYHGTSFEH